MADFEHGSTQIIASYANFVKHRVLRFVNSNSDFSLQECET